MVSSTVKSIIKVFLSTKKRAFYFFQLSKTSLVAFFLAACSGEKQQVQSDDDNGHTQPTDPTPLPPNSNSIIIEAGKTFYGVSGTNDIISANSDTFINGTQIIDESPYDSDILTISTDKDITDQPIVSGVETITFITASQSIENDTELDIDLQNISEVKTIYFENSNSESIINKLYVRNATSELHIGKSFSSINVATKENADITFVMYSDLNVATSGDTKNLFFKAGGESLNITSSTAYGNIEVENSGTLVVTAPRLTGNLDATSNGDVTITDLNLLKGNVNIQSVGKIDVLKLPSSTGNLTLNNQRAIPGTDISINNANKVGMVKITSAGAILAKENQGLASAAIIDFSMAADSEFFADDVAGQVITLNSVNKSGSTVTIKVNASTVETLNIGGTSPIIVEIDGVDISSETVNNTNSSAVLHLSPFSTDLSEVSKSVSLWLKNHDGKTIGVANEQNFYFDAEIPQTSTVSTLHFDHVVDATNSTDNKITITTRDSVQTNSDKIVNWDGLNFTDIQTLNLNTSSGVSIYSTANLTGSDLKTVNITGSGDFDLENNTITGATNSTISLDASNLSGKITLEVDGTADSLSSIIGGAGDDYITLNGVSTNASGFTLQSKDGSDTFRITTNADGSNAKININGGDGKDTLIFDANVDLGDSTFIFSAVEELIFFRGGSNTTLTASSISGSSAKIGTEGSGNIKITVEANQSTIDLSSVTLKNSFDTSSDQLIINGSGASSGITAKGTKAIDVITGSNANDNLSGGGGNDVISAGTGNDVINGGKGADTLTGGAGDDEFDFAALSSTVLSLDKISDYQATAADSHNDTIDNVTGTVGADTAAAIDVKQSIANGSGSETVKAAVAGGIVTLSGSDAGLINTLNEWADVISTDGIISVAGDDADATGTVAFQFNGNTYLVESKDDFNNNTPNVSIQTFIELTGLTGVSKVDNTAAADTILIA